MLVPDNVTVRSRRPQAAVLPHMSAVVTNGCLSTITAALAVGVPLLVVPHGRDQHLNAQRVAATGAGRAVLKDAPPAELAAAVTTVLGDPSASAAARTSPPRPRS